MVPSSKPLVKPCCTATCPAYADIKKLEGFLADPATAKNVSGPEQKRLVHTFLAAVARQASDIESDVFLGSLDALHLGGAVLGCLFDLCSNVEYLARVNWGSGTPKWLSCSGDSHPSSVRGQVVPDEDAEDEMALAIDSDIDAGLAQVQARLDAGVRALGFEPQEADVDLSPRAYFSFLRACPRCSYQWGHIPPVPNRPVTGNFSPKFVVTGNKPGSGPLGDITSGLMAMLIQMMLRATGSGFDARLVTKQNHPVDLVLASPDLLALCETKASPLVSYPVCTPLNDRVADHTSGISVDALNSELALYIPHRDWEIPLGRPSAEAWPFSALCTKLEEDPTIAVRLVSAWYQLFLAYQVPKRRRNRTTQHLSLLTNGWGDNTDSNKTKAGLGRSDDMKKGTYQMLHFGSLFKDRCEKRAIHVALLANMDPVNMYAEYLEPLQDALWTTVPGEIRDGRLMLPAQRVHRLYDAIVTFNRMHPVEGPLPDALDLRKFWAAIGTSDGLSRVEVWSVNSS